MLGKMQLDELLLWGWEELVLKEFNLQEGLRAIIKEAFLLEVILVQVENLREVNLLDLALDLIRLAHMPHSSRVNLSRN